jgi:glycosyltransferase involved in cell wall biosynthesis
MASPTVSFVVPCYRLAHLLPDCIHSILSQNYPHFEVLVMDDCSPDDVAKSIRTFDDPRLRYVRNPVNLGHLRNYNKGISLTRGKYVWLISADDYLRVPYVLAEYVRFLEASSTVGYVFCAGVGARDGLETTVIGRYPGRGTVPRIIPGHLMLKKLFPSNFVLAPSGLVRRECYDRLGGFPLSMPWSGDWYLWCLFALHYDVGYFDEPMVCYRDHSLSMTRKLTQENLQACASEDIAIPWIIRRMAQDAGYGAVATDCLTAIGQTYAKVIASSRYRNLGTITLERFESDLRQNIGCELERDIVRARMYADAANEYYWAGDAARARTFYGAALSADPLMVSVFIKALLLALGRPGAYVRTKLLAARRLLSGA